jgi:hypothetical protein
LFTVASSNAKKKKINEIKKRIVVDNKAVHEAVHTALSL